MVRLSICSVGRGGHLLLPVGEAVAAHEQPPEQRLMFHCKIQRKILNGARTIASFIIPTKGY